MCVSKDNSERLSMRIKQCHHIISFETHTDTTNSPTYLGTCNGRAGHSAESSCAHHFDKVKGGVCVGGCWFVCDIRNTRSLLIGWQDHSHGRGLMCSLGKIP